VRARVLCRAQLAIFMISYSLFSDYNRNQIATIHFVRAIPRMDLITRESLHFLTNLELNLT
jgi:hypothetical protein